MKTIEISEEAFNRFESVKKYHSNDEALNQLMDDREAVEKHINEYLDARDECIDDTILGRRVIANHCIVGGMCTKCGAMYSEQFV